jgi:hypothetical protein
VLFFRAPSREENNVLVKVDSSVGKLAERSSLLELSGLLGVLYNKPIVSTMPIEKIQTTIGLAPVPPSHGRQLQRVVEDVEELNIRIRQP